MCLNMIGHIIAATVSTQAINALVQCAESIILPPYSNVLVKCKIPKVLKSKNYERILVFEPSYRHKSDFAYCKMYKGTVVMDDEVINSHIFSIAMRFAQYTDLSLLRKT